MFSRRRDSETYTLYLDFDFCLGSGGKHSGASVDQPSGTATELLAVLSKSPMPAASKALALEYAAKNIRFNTISPAVVNRGLQVQPKQTVKVTLCPPDGVPSTFGPIGLSFGQQVSASQRERTFWRR